MRRINQLGKLNREVLKDNVKIRIAILTVLAACTVGVLVWSIIKTDVIGYILDVLLLAMFVFYLTCNIIIMPIEHRKYKYRNLSESDIEEINAYINLLEGEKSNVAKRSDLIMLIDKHDEYVKREEERKTKRESGESTEFTLEELERFARENPSSEESDATSSDAAQTDGTVDSTQGAEDTVGNSVMQNTQSHGVIDGDNNLNK